MCLKYNLQETADCVSRQREAAMSPAHHTFLIDCDSGVCVCLTGAPQPLSQGTSVSQTPMVSSSRRLLRTCLTSCMKEQRPETLDADGSLRTDASCVKRKTSIRPTSIRPLTKTTGQKTGGRFLQDSLKRWIWRLASCVCPE